MPTNPPEVQSGRRVVPRLRPDQLRRLAAAPPEPGRRGDVVAWSVRPEPVLRWLLVTIGALTLASLVSFSLSQLLPDVPGLGSTATLLSLNDEANVPTSFAFLQLVVCALAAAAVAALVRRQGRPGAAHWLGVAAALLAVGFDELLTLHERLNDSMTARTGASSLSQAWVIPALVVVAVLTVVFVPFVRRLPPPVRRRVVVAAALFVGGAALFEMAGALYSDHVSGWWFTWMLFWTAEEVCELVAVALMLSAILRHARDHLDPVTLELGTGGT